ncbi:MAG: hypothetical protein EUB_01837 [Eubacterium sp.]|uniref:prepilin-type N-terminal cleavage/methylation domain-containing protein n=1 Tax=Eubacterium sp. TaxID=142586 RepID=UPI00302BF44C
MNLIHKLKNRDGFTLVELIVTLAILSIVLVVAGNYLFFGNRFFSQNEVKNTDKFIGDSIYEFMREKLVYATEVEIINPSSSAEPKYDNVFKVETILDKNSGYLLFGEKKNPSNIYGSGYYRGNGISYTIKISDDNTTRLDLEVQVYNQNSEIVYKTGATVKNINIDLNTVSQAEDHIIVTGKEEGKVEHVYVNPVISFNEKKVVSNDPYTFPANSLYEQMERCVLDFQKLKNGEITKEEYKAIYGKYYPNPNSIYLNNDIFSKYIYETYYQDSWPTFPDQVLKQLNIKGPLYMRVYLNAATCEITVLGSTSNNVNGGGWNWLMYYKNWDEKGNILKEGKWYYRYDKKAPYVTNITHQYVDELINSSTADRLVEFIPE